MRSILSPDSAADAERYSAAALRARFRNARHPTPYEAADDDNRHMQAAVLIPLVAHAGATRVLLTRRTDHLHHHAGQISFPGGRRDPGDESATHTALRETEEEVGLAAPSIQILGALPGFNTPSGFSITPVVGLLEAPLHLALDSFEVAEAFEVPLAFLADPLHYQRHRIRFEGREREVFAVPWAGRFIWGATAGMLAMLAEFLHA
jgi:8-oxo-dGTP pyrophosphatase MutT (NUDIX family)